MVVVLIGLEVEAVGVGHSELENHSRVVGSLRLEEGRPLEAHPAACNHSLDSPVEEERSPRISNEILVKSHTTLPSVRFTYPKCT